MFSMGRIAPAGSVLLNKMLKKTVPNLPYAWDREIKILAQKHKEDALAKVLSMTARSFFRLGAS